MKIAAALVLYNTDPHEVSNNIKTFIDFVDVLYIYDNTEKIIHFNYQALSPKIHYYWDGINEGIAKRLNCAAKIASDNHYKWLLTMDQDSSFSEKNIDEYISKFNTYSEDNSIAIMGLSSDDDDINSTETNDFIIVNHLITSGSIINIDVHNVVGGFDENLFIDGIDWDYCINTKLAGFKSIKFPEIKMLHNLGEKVNRASIKSLFLIKKEKSIHNPIRCYYMKRNLLYLQKKYNKYNLSTIDELTNHTEAHLKICLLYGRHFVKTLIMINMGKKDFRAKVFGKKK